MNPMDLLRVEFRTLGELADKLKIRANTLYLWNRNQKFIKDIDLKFH